ncbi:MAG: hypothetical protein P8R04_01480 [Gammaproteobacteria bacterium]|nr:hypothetical protein [Gammaproteobacteria bacterium]
MSSLAYIGMLITAIVSLLVGLNLGKRIAYKSRSPRDKDPRDQAIRELRAELRIAQRSVDIAKESEEEAYSDIGYIQNDLKKKSSLLKDLEQKFAITKDTLRNETKKKQTLEDQQNRYRLEIEKLRNQVHELEIEADLSSGSNMLLDEKLTDNSALEEAEAEIKELKQRISMTQKQIS